MYASAPDVLIGDKASVELADWIRSRPQIRSVLIMIDDNVAKNAPCWSEFYEGIAEVSMVRVFPVSVRFEPTYELLEEIRKILRLASKPDLVIGIGGGSVMDTAKASAALINNKREAIEYRGFNALEVPGVPVVCVPTTAGSGSEATPNAVFTDELSGKKLGINGRYVSAALAVLDARWLESTPPEVALSSGLDALVHALESFVTVKSTPFSKRFSALATQMIFASFEKALVERKEFVQRQVMLEASFLAANALCNSGSGISGALSYPIGVMFKVPHGYAGGVTLPLVVRWNIERGYHDYADLMTDKKAESLDERAELAEKFLHELESLYSRIKARRSFSYWNLSVQDGEKIRVASADLQLAFDQNPIFFSAQSDISAVLEQVFSN